MQSFWWKQAALYILLTVLVAVLLLCHYERQRLGVHVLLDNSHEQPKFIWPTREINKIYSVTISTDKGKHDVLWEITLNSLPRETSYGQCENPCIQVFPTEGRMPRKFMNYEQIFVAIGVQYDSWFDAYVEEWQFEFQYIESQNSIVLRQIGPK